VELAGNLRSGILESPYQPLIERVWKTLNPIATLQQMDKEIRQLLIEARNELDALRRQNQIMGAQIDVIEVFRAALIGPRQMAMQVDLAYRINDYLSNHPE
jgi:hypothetical protein